MRAPGRRTRPGPWSARSGSGLVGPERITGRQPGAFRTHDYAVIARGPTSSHAGICSFKRWSPRRVFPPRLTQGPERRDPRSYESLPSVPKGQADHAPRLGVSWESLSGRSTAGGQAPHPAGRGPRLRRPLDRSCAPGPRGPRHDLNAARVKVKLPKWSHDNEVSRATSPRQRV